ncbi:hypothetical protein E2C01_019565 [Portunus trituberculatus]|uniref:Uncharacterized protein n=1 Tax=Portunus trituberculatus TaxID=210409 RepID=A0A5B7DZB6_PORTR|nr:hypothetical protein [Portunus trituberculatus]
MCKTLRKTKAFHSNPIPALSCGALASHHHHHLPPPPPATTNLYHYWTPPPPPPEPTTTNHQPTNQPPTNQHSCQWLPKPLPPASTASFQPPVSFRAFPEPAVASHGLLNPPQPPVAYTGTPSTFSGLRRHSRPLLNLPVPWWSPRPSVAHKCPLWPFWPSREHSLAPPQSSLVSPILNLPRPHLTCPSSLTRPHLLNLNSAWPQPHPVPASPEPGLTWPKPHMASLGLSLT